MIAISPRPARDNWGMMSFASTLYLCPILDLLLAKIPPNRQSEIRLGLQEALVNAAKHGNKLDPSKTVVVYYYITSDRYMWIISDAGEGFEPSHCDDADPEALLPAEEAESGRGLCILHQIFDQVYWNSRGTQLKLCKFLRKKVRKRDVLANKLMSLR